VGNLPHGSFASSDWAVFVVTSSGPGNAHALRSGRVWEAAVWGATGRCHPDNVADARQAHRSYASLTTETTQRAVWTKYVGGGGGIIV
jgi:hypothetical protein